MRRGKRVGLVLAGGGFKGAYQLGFLLALKEKGFSFDVVCGISVGALNGALVAQDDISRLNELWLEIERLGPHAIFSYWPFYKMPFKRSLCSSEPLRRLLNKYIDADKIKSSSTKFYYGAVCLEDARLRYFDNAYDRVVDGLLASAALPPFFEPVMIEGKHYVDGGVVCNVPIRKAIEEGCDQIFVALTSPEQPKEISTTLSRFGAIKRCVELFVWSRDRAHMEIAELWDPQLIRSADYVKKDIA